MKGDIIPDAHHVSRLCGGSHIREDGTISATAFKPRSGETYISVNWLEFLSLPDRGAELAELRRVLSTKRKIGGTAKFATLNAGEIAAAVREQTRNRIAISVRHEPEADPGRPQDPSHAGIYGVPEDDNIVVELIAQSIREIHSAR
jgi:hypothetical protein